MKKIISILFLLTLITSTMLSGTLANYTTTFDEIAAGTTVAKEFIFLEDGEDTFSQGVKIAPTERVVWNFGVKNYDGEIISETDMEYELTFDVTASPGKQAIAPLVITIKDESGTVLKTLEGVGLMTVDGVFPLSSVGQSANYTVEIYWPSNDSVDIQYAGSDFSTTIVVGAYANQIVSGSVDPEDPEEPDTVSSELIVDQVYSASAYSFIIKIHNPTSEPISNWDLRFAYNGTINTIWADGSAIKLTKKNGTFTVKPQDKWQAAYTIPANSTLILSGNGGTVGTALSNATLSDTVIPMTLTTP